MVRVILFTDALMEVHIYSSTEEDDLLKDLRIMTQILKCFKNYAITFNIIEKFLKV